MERVFFSPQRATDDWNVKLENILFREVDEIGQHETKCRKTRRITHTQKKQQ